MSILRITVNLPFLAFVWQYERPTLNCDVAWSHNQYFLHKLSLEIKENLHKTAGNPDNVVVWSLSLASAVYISFIELQLINRLFLSKGKNITIVLSTCNKGVFNICFNILQTEKRLRLKCRWDFFPRQIYLPWYKLTVEGKHTVQKSI